MKFDKNGKPIAEDAPAADEARGDGAPVGTAPVMVQLTNDQLRQLMAPQAEPTPAEAAQRAAEIQDNETRETPQLVAPVVEGARVVADRQRELAFANNVLGMFEAMVRGDQAGIRAAHEVLVIDGHYGTPAAQRVESIGYRDFYSEAVTEVRDLSRRQGRLTQRAAGDWYSTVVDADGGFLLPVVVRDGIEEIAGRYGVARQIADVFTHIVGSIKVPGGSGAESAFSAVAEGGAIASSMRAFRAISLNPQKWATIVPWTYEVNVEAGPKVLADLQRVIGRAAARSEDDTMINGAGNAAYNSIYGLFNYTSANGGSGISGNAPATYALASGKTTYASIGPDDLILARNSVPAGVRTGLSYVFHPDMETVFLTMKDNAGQYLFDYAVVDGVGRLKGIPVYYTEALPANSAGSQANTNFGLLGNFQFWKMAAGPGFSSEEMRTGTVKDADTGDDVNLNTQDLRALKFRMFFDMGCNFGTAFVKFATAAS